MICSECGKTTEQLYSGMCQGCYKYFRSGGIVHPLPEVGTIAHDESGKVICHICGRSYTRLGSHVKESHGMTIAEYKEEFELCSRTKTTEKSYSQLMHDLALLNDMDKQLMDSGKNTRIRKGQTEHRKNKKVRLQEIIDKRNRKKKEE